MRRIVALALVFAFVPALAAAEAAPSGAIDATITIGAAGVPQIDGPPGLVRFEDSTPGDRYSFNLTLTAAYTTLEVRAHGLKIERPSQLVPSLVLHESEYPLFYEFPNDRIWEVDSPARVFFVNGTAEDVVLRLGLMGPANVTLLLDRDVTPPRYTIGEIANVTTFSFYQETTTDELAIGDLQVREVGKPEWVVNPTPLLHFRQRFPIQGLNPDRDYEARFVFTDWAGNNVTTPTYTVHTAQRPVVPLPRITPLAPQANTTLVAGAISVRARIDSDSEVPADGVRVFFDKKEVSSNATFNGTEVVYVPDGTLAPGHHSVAVEVTNAAGGEAVARWSFEIASGKTPLPTAATLVGVLMAAAALAATTRRRDP